MTHWDYRVVKTKVGKEIRYGIHEVYYNSRGKPKAYTEDSISVIDVYKHELNEYTAAEVRRVIGTQLVQMAQALGKPILTEADFKKKK